MNAVPQLTRGDLAEATQRALSLCHDINCPEAVVDSIWAANLSVSDIGNRLLGDALERERARRAEQSQKQEA